MYIAVGRYYQLLQRERREDNWIRIKGGKEREIDWKI
jgi:hypothetical protein